MAYGKNKGLNKGGKKGAKKKQMDPFLRKVWYDVKAPTFFKSANRRAGRTPVTRTTGNKTETDGLKGRVCEFNMADLNDQPEDGFKRVKLCVEEIQGKSCLTDFHAMQITRDKMCALIKKKHTLIDVWADCKTTDGFTVRLFAIGFTARVDDRKPGGSQQLKQLCYAQTAQIRRIRRRMVAIMQQEVAKGKLREAVKALCLSTLEEKMKQQTQRVFPLDPVLIYKAKVVKKPKMDIVQLMEIHEKGGDDTGAEMAGDSEEKNLVDA